MILLTVLVPGLCMVGQRFLISPFLVLSLAPYNHHSASERSASSDSQCTGEQAELAGLCQVCAKSVPGLCQVCLNSFTTSVSTHVIANDWEPLVFSVEQTNVGEVILNLQRRKDNTVASRSGLLNLLLE